MSKRWRGVATILLFAFLHVCFQTIVNIVDGVLQIFGWLRFNNLYLAKNCDAHFQSYPSLDLYINVYDEHYIKNN